MACVWRVYLASGEGMRAGATTHGRRRRRRRRWRWKEEEGDAADRTKVAAGDVRDSVREGLLRGLSMVKVCVCVCVGERD